MFVRFNRSKICTSVLQVFFEFIRRVRSFTPLPVNISIHGLFTKKGVRRKDEGRTGKKGEDRKEKHGKRWKRIEEKGVK